MKLKPLAFFFLASSFIVKAQLMDSLPHIIKQKYSIDARLDSRYSFIGGEIAAINGLRLGVAFQRKLRLGTGLSWMSTNLPVRVIPYETPAGQRDFRYLKFGYLSFYADFVFHKTKRWQLSVPLQLGPGLLWYQRNRGYHFYKSEPKHLIVLYEPGITVQFKIFKWLGLGSEVAYRFAAKNNSSIPQRLSSPTYALKLLLWPDQLYFDLLPDSELSKRFGPSYW